MLGELAELHVRGAGVDEWLHDVWLDADVDVRTALQGITHDQLEICLHRSDLSSVDGRIGAGSGVALVSE